MFCGLLEGQRREVPTTATLRGKETPPGALVPVKNILKKDRVQDKALGRGGVSLYFCV